MDDRVEGPSAAKKQKIEDRGSLQSQLLVLPHSNAAEERVFSMVTKNKTALTPSLKLDGTLSSILTIIQSHISSMRQQVLFWKLLKGLRWSIIGCIAARANCICH